jgi:hypothetical protein
VLYPPTCVQHKATGIVFEITPDPANDARDELGFSDFRADILLSGESDTAPGEEAIADLRKHAVYISLHALRLIQFS